jgi:hypothetical protein
LVHPSTKDRDENIPYGTAPCDPIIAFGRFVVSATSDGRVCFFSIHKQKEPCRPVTEIEVDIRSSLTGLVAAPAGVSLVRYRSTVNKNRFLKPPGFLGHVVAISSESDVHILECSTNGNVKKLFSWNSGTCSISCATVRPDRTGQWRLALGYESGCLEEWLVSISVRETTNKEMTENNGEETNEIVQVEWKPLMRRVFPQLLFRGQFDLPIRSVSSLGVNTTEVEVNPDLSTKESSPFHNDEAPKEETKEDETNSSTQKAEENDDETKTIQPNLVMNDTRDYLSVCLVLNPREQDDNLARPVSSSQIEVLKAHTLERDWITMLEQEELASTKGSKGFALPLHEYCVWPHAEMEIHDTSLLSTQDSDGQRRLSRRIRGLPSQGSDRMCASIGEAIPFFVAALSDGTVARMRASIEEGLLCWGVQKDFDQVVLSFPAIGIAPVNLSTGTSVLACCLRGGTVYLVPEGEHLEPITVILGPVDKDQESTINYLHGFTAGNVCVDGIPGLAVLVFASAGGTLQVFSCALLTQTEEDNVFQELVHNGSVELLRDLLCSVEEDDQLLAPDVRKKAREELMQTSADQVTIDLLNSPSFVNTRELLLKLSKEEYIV